jgi:uncharacterized YigZ family protein
MLFEDTYRTINAASTGSYKEKSSKFIALAYPVLTEADVNHRLKSVKKEYYDANHHCYAYRLGFEKQLFRFSDDREPSGSAGRPIYGQILSQDLTNILVVVVRYFGGIKLGVSGLINAYKTATKEALYESNIVVKTVKEIYFVEFDYEVMNDVMKVLKDTGIQQIESSYDQRCRLNVSIQRSSAKYFVEELNKIKNVTLKYMLTL